MRVATVYSSVAESLRAVKVGIEKVRSPFRVNETVERELHPVVQEAQARSPLPLVKGRQKRGSQFLDEPPHPVMTTPTHKGKSVPKVRSLNYAEYGGDKASQWRPPAR